MAKMRVTVQLCAAVTAVVGVVLAAEHVEQRQVIHNSRMGIAASPLPEESQIYARNRRLFSEAQGRQWARPTIHSRQYTQEEPDPSTTYWATVRNRRRYSLGGRARTRNLHTGDMTAARHEPRAPRPVRISSDSVNDPSPVTRPRTTDNIFSSRVHQEGLQTSTNDRRSLPSVRESPEERVLPTPRDRFQSPLPERNVEIRNRVSYDDERVTHTPSVAGRGVHAYSGSLTAFSRSVERPAHHRHQVPDTHSGLDSTNDPSTPTTSTRGTSREPDDPRERLRTQHGFSEISDEINNDVRQRLDKPDLCCGSRVSFDPSTAQATGAFERVASAGSIKVVEVPAHNSFPPSEVRDLQAAPLGLHTLSLTWTAPGEDLDSGTVSGYHIRLSEARGDLQESQFDAAPEETLLEASETLTAAGVYQTAGTRVGVEVPLLRQLQRGRVYYVALKAQDSDGYSSGVSNVAQFSIPETSTDTTRAASHGTSTTNHMWVDPRIEEVPGTSSSPGSVSRDGEMAVFSEENPTPPPPRGSYTASESETQTSSGGNNEQQSLLSTSPSPTSDPSQADGSGNQRKRDRRKDRRRKKNKNSKRRKGRRRNGRRRNSRRGGNSNTSVWKSHALDIYAELERWNES